MNEHDRITRGEVTLVVALVLACALVWAKWPEIKVSSKTLENYDLRDPRAPAWRNGIGLTISARRLQDASELGPELSGRGDLLGQYLVVAVDVDIEGANFPTMVDLPYERLSLTDADGRTYHLANQSVSTNGADAPLRLALEKFDWSIVNNTFTRQPRHETGLLLFDPAAAEAEGLVLRVNAYHHPYKQLDLAFPLHWRPKSRTRGSEMRALR